MTWLHSWVGLLFAFVLYFVFLTGAAGYFQYEITYWMQPERTGFAPAPREPQSQLAEQAVRHLRGKIASAEYWYVAFPLGERDSTRLYVFAEPTPGDAAEAEGDYAKFLDAPHGADGADVRETAGGGMLYYMHYALHYMPERWAMYLVGIAAMFMLVGVASGVVAHQRIFAEFFTFRPGTGQQSWLDAHKLTAVFALPFMVMITYSGLLLFNYELVPAVKAAAYRGDEARFEFERLGQDFHHTEAAGARVETVPIGSLIASAEERWGPDAIMGFEVIHPDDANAKVAIFGRRRGVLNEHYPEMWFEGASGSFIREVTPPRLPGTAFPEVLFGLHEGNYAGPLLRWLYLLTGLAGAAVVATGQVVWTRRRRQKLNRSARLEAGLALVERLNVGLIAGLPIGIAAYFWANRLIPASAEGRADWEVHALFLAWGVALLHAALRGQVGQAWREQLAVLAALLMLLPILNAITTEAHLAATLASGDWVRAGFDLAMVALGLLVILIARVVGRSRSAGAGESAPGSAGSAGALAD